MISLARSTLRKIFHLSSVQRRIGLIFLAFLCLLLISVIVTFLGLETQRQDARIINLAGRQRMLLQQMSTLAFSHDSDEALDSAALRATADTFERTLAALRSGGAIQDYTGERIQLPPPSDAALQANLDALQVAWDACRPALDRLLQPGGGQDAAAVREIAVRTPALIERADRVVRAFEGVSNARIARLRAYQLGFLALGLALLSAGWWITSAAVVRPLGRLEQAAQRIGAGDLSTPLQPQGPEEVRILGQTLETMRQQLQTSRLDLQHWAETLESRVQQRTRELEALAAVSREINSHLSIEEVLTSVTEKARSLLGGEVASLCLLDEGGKVLTLHAAAAPETAIRASQSPLDNPLVGQVLEHHCAHPCGLQSREGFCQIISPAYRTSHLAAPLYSRGRVSGAICVGSSVGDTFRPEMLEVLTQLSDVAVVALENSRLYQQAENLAVLEERQRMAAEMHDGLLQTLNFLRLMVGMLRDQLERGQAEGAYNTMCQVERAEAQAEVEIRRAIDSLQVDFPLNDSLQERLGVLAAELSAGIPVQVETSALIPLVLPRQESEQVLRIAREAVLNAQRYSAAPRVKVCLEKAGPEWVLLVRDEGVGFRPEAAPADGRQHFGLKIMRARAARLGGALGVYSQPGAGTRVELRWTPGAQQKN